MSRDNPCHKISKVPPAQPGTRPELGSRAELEVLRQKIVELIGQKPDKAAIVLAGWIKQPAGKKKAG